MNKHASNCPSSTDSCHAIHRGSDQSVEFVFAGNKIDYSFSFNSVSYILPNEQQYAGYLTVYAERSIDNIIGGSREGAGGLDPLKNQKNIGFLSNTGPDPLKNHKAT